MRDQGSGIHDRRHDKISRLTDRLFTPRFFVMCGFSFTVFLSAFQLLPTAPFHILALGGSTAAAGLFLGFLTYASAFSAPVTGTLADRVGPRRMLIAASVAITVFSIAYALIPSYKVMLALVLVHGVFWSGLLTGSAAYMTNMLPESRRAEGIGYWGLSTIAAIAVAPSIGFWVFHFGWRALCLEAAALNVVMGIIAWKLPPELTIHAAHHHHHHRRLIEWRVLILSVTLFLYTFGYGGITSFTALYADANGVSPKGIYLTAGDRDPRHSPDVGPPRRHVRLPSRVRAVPRADRGRAGAARHGRLARLAAGERRGLRRRLRHGVPGLRRLRDALGAGGPPRRRVRRDPRLLRHRHRHGLDQHGLDHRALRLPARLRDRGPPVDARDPVLPGS